MEHYEQIMKRVKCVVEERIDVNLSAICGNAGIDVSLYCAEYDFQFGKRIYYRELEMEEPVLYTANKLVGEFEQELVRNIEVK